MVRQVPLISIFFFLDRDNGPVPTSRQAETQSPWFRIDGTWECSDLVRQYDLTSLLIAFAEILRIVVAPDGAG